MNNCLNKVAITMIATLTLAFGYGAFVGYVSDYEIVITKERRSAQIVTYRGKVTALHVQYDENGQLLSKWKITAWQLIFGHQWVRIFESHELIVGGENDDYVSRENRLMQDLSVRFSRFDREGDVIYIWDNFPTPTLYKGTIRGRLEQ